MGWGGGETGGWRGRSSMAGSKGGSMREGPLAALFRKTEELNRPEGGDDESRERKAPPPHPRETGVPHPALRDSQRAADAAPIPTPQERLRHAFSSELPENILERPQATATDVYARAQADARTTIARTVGQPVLRVVGVGGAGVNAVNRMVEAEVEGVEVLAMQTRPQSLQQSTADVTLHIGAELTRGLGSGSDASIGRAAAMEDYDHIKSLLKSSDMI